MAKRQSEDSKSMDKNFVKRERRSFQSGEETEEEDAGIDIKPSFPSTNLAAQARKMMLQNQKLAKEERSNNDLEQESMEEINEVLLKENRFRDSMSVTTVEEPMSESLSNSTKMSLVNHGSLNNLTRFAESESTFNILATQSETVTLYRKTSISSGALQRLEEGYAKLLASKSSSLLKKHLTKPLFDKLKYKVTLTFGSTLLDCIQSGLENHDSLIGVYAPDEECYALFEDLFHPIIEEYHCGFKYTHAQPLPDYGKANKFGILDPDGRYIISTRIRCSRSLKGFPFNPSLTEMHYKFIENKVKTCLTKLQGDLQGSYQSLSDMDEGTQQKLIDEHYLFKNNDRFLKAAKALHYWPIGRGIFLNESKTLIIWCNEEDHLRIISMQNGSDVGAVYERLIAALKVIEKDLAFNHSGRLGFLNFCPSNLGTAIRASVLIKLPKLLASKDTLDTLADTYKLQIRGFKGEHSEAENGICDVSNKRRLGLTEFQAVQEMFEGVAKLIEFEKTL